MARTGRGDALPVKIVVVANPLSFLHGNLEQGSLRLLDSALAFDFRCHISCAGHRSVDFSASGKPRGLHERRFRDSVRSSHATGRLEPRRH
jgi:hypothetical protein